MCVVYLLTATCASSTHNGNEQINNDADNNNNMVQSPCPPLIITPYQATLAAEQRNVHKRSADSASTMWLYGDAKLCNVYHECKCTQQQAQKQLESSSSESSSRSDLDDSAAPLNATTHMCVFVRTSVCPVGQVFLTRTANCESIELHGCDTSYLQTMSLSASEIREQQQQQQQQQPAKKRKEEHERSLPTESNSSDSSGMSSMTNQITTSFECPSGANNRYADPHICNVFHVCVTQSGQTYDQPFLCPGASVFRVVDENSMYCDARAPHDCVGKAFYRTLMSNGLYSDEDGSNDDKDQDQQEREAKSRFDASSPSTCEFGGKREDPLFCNLYHECRDGVERTYMCDNELLFNAVSNACDHAMHVVCAEKSVYAIEDVAKVTHQHTAINDTTIITNYTTTSASTTTTAALTSTTMTTATTTTTTTTATTTSAIEPMTKAGDFIVANQTTTTAASATSMLNKIKLAEYRLGPQASVATLFGLAHNQQMLQSQQQQQQQLDANSVMQSATSSNSLSSSSSVELSGIEFNCRHMPSGHWRNDKYCDLYHACVNGERRKSYSCAQLGEPIYFDDITKR